MALEIQEHGCPRLLGSMEASGYITTWQMASWESKGGVRDSGGALSEEER